MSELLDLAQAAVDAARAAGADFCDAYCSDLTEISVSVEKNSINNCATIRDQGLSVRAFARGGQGFATAQQLNLESGLVGFVLFPAQFGLIRVFAGVKAAHFVICCRWEY